MANCKSTLVLNCILASFEPALVSDNALAMCELIKAADATAYPKYHLYVSLGAAMCSFPPPKETQLQIINDVWAEIAKIKSAREYTPIASNSYELLPLATSHHHRFPTGTRRSPRSSSASCSRSSPSTRCASY